MTRLEIGLRRNGALIAATGIVFAAAAWPALYLPSWAFLTIGHWPFHAAPEMADMTHRLLMAISGGLTAGFGAMLWALSALATKDPAAVRRSVWMTSCSWFGVDSTGSMMAGAPMNVALNLVFLALMLTPVWRAPETEKVQT